MFLSVEKQSQVKVSECFKCLKSMSACSDFFLFPPLIASKHFMAVCSVNIYHQFIRFVTFFDTHSFCFSVGKGSLKNIYF